MKKILSLILLTTILLSAIFVPSATMIASADADTVPTYYVDAANGDDSNNGLSDTTAFATIKKAEEAAVAAGDKGATIYVKGNADFEGRVAHSGVHNIIGDNGSLTYAGEYLNGVKNQAILYGPTKFENFKLTKGSSSQFLVTNAFDSEFTNCTGNAPQLLIGPYDSANTANREKFVLNGWSGSSYYDIYLDNMSNTNEDFGGADIYIQGELVSSKNPNVYINFDEKVKLDNVCRGDLNFIFNTSQVDMIQFYSNFSSKFSLADTAAFQVIINNYDGTKMPQKINNVTATNKWVIRSLEGGTLDVTDTAGVYNVDSDKVALATKVGSSDDPIQSVNGKLDLTSAGAGEYSVSYGTVVEPDSGDGALDDPRYETVDTVYISENGDNKKDGLTAETAVSTVENALKLFKKSNATSKTLMIDGKVNLPVLANHSEMIIIKGLNDKATVNLPIQLYNQINKSCYILTGPTTFEDINLINPQYILTNGYELVTNNCGVPMSNTQLYIGKLDSSAHQGNQKVVLGDWVGSKSNDEYLDIYLFDKTNRADAIDLVIEGDKHSFVNLVGNITFEGNVSVTWNGKPDTSKNPSGKNDGICTWVKNDMDIQGAFNFILNNNNEQYINSSNDAFRTSDFVASKGKYFIYSSDTNGKKIGATDVAGVFNIEGGYAARAINRDKSSISYIGANTITIDEPGSYDIDYFVLGDINDDLAFDVRDLVALKKYTANSSPAYKLGFDLEYDNAINGGDLVAIRKELLGIGKYGIKSIPKNVIQTATYNQSGGADAEANSLNGTISSYGNIQKQNASYYYVSSSEGKAGNDGSYDSPFASIEDVNDKVPANSGNILFKRGDTFRTSESLELKSGNVYSVYGDKGAPKPLISGSPANYADAASWSEYATNIWQLDLGNGVTLTNVVFNEGEASGYKRNSVKELVKDGEYYYDGSTLYLYFTHHNPGKYFNSIEIHSTRDLLVGSGQVSDITVNNLDIRYSSRHGIVFDGVVSDITISGCEIGWIGGEASNNTRMGNGIEFYNDASNCTVEYNNIYQVFDAAVTFQNGTNYSNFKILNNLIEYCSFNLEFWFDSEKSGIIENVAMNNNILRFSGMGYAGQQRADGGSQAYIVNMTNGIENITFKTNIQMSGNIFDCADSYFAFSKNAPMHANINFSNNTYYQKAGSFYGIYLEDVNTDAKPNNQYAFAEEIHKFDSTGTAIWVSAK